MGIKSKIKNFIKKKFVREIKIPVYIPVESGNRLNGKNVLITGGSGGIGFAIANACLRNGANIIITGRDQVKLDETCKKLSENIENKCEVYGIVLDIKDTVNIKEKIENASAMFKNNQIDILVNNAGVAGAGNIGMTDVDDYDKVLNTNLKGTYFMAQEFSNYLISNHLKGNILNISSASGVRPAISPYMVSKWGEIGLTQGLAKKLIPYEIVVNGIAPGPTATDMLHKDGSDLMYDNSPAKRFTDPVEVANLAVFLISDSGKMIIGDTVYITGGCGTLTLDDIRYN